MLVQVAVPVPRLPCLTYQAKTDQAIAVGMRVVVPLGRRVVTGVVVEMDVQKPQDVKTLRNVVKQLDETPALDGMLLELGRWMSGYYHCTWGEALSAMLPGSMQPRRVETYRLADTAANPAGEPLRGHGQSLVEKLLHGPMTRQNLLSGLPASAQAALRRLLAKGVIVKGHREAFPEEERPQIAAPLEQGPDLTAHQASAMNRIRMALSEEMFKVFLLHGVTGSGKTEVYIQAIAQVLAKGQGAILLVPEISLTPQTCARIASRFGDQVALLHSALTPKTRMDAWHRLRSGHANVAVGPRSAVFAPIRRLGLIIVDEEYETSFKQEDVPRYNARDVAAKRAQMEKAVLVLGSATPAIESYHNALQGRYELLSMPDRVDHKRLPEVIAVDMTREYADRKGEPVFSQALLSGLADRLEKDEQSILFLNRRGFAPWVMCPACQHVVVCPHCSVSMVYHQASDRLICHTCGHSAPPRPACPKCGTACIRLAGAGTQRIESELKRLFPQARIIRIDQDTVRKRGHLETSLELFGRGEADILIGTQMVAKGIDYPNVTLVGIISADTALHLPDFRAEEKTFQLLVQVAGRAGRGGKPGTVLAQTHTISHPLIPLAQRQDYPAFFEREIAQRRDLDYPPFTRMAMIICRGRSSGTVLRQAEKIAATMRGVSRTGDTVLGPVPSPKQKIAKEHRFQILIKCPGPAARKRLLEAADSVKPISGVRVIIDVDPQNMM